MRQLHGFLVAMALISSISSAHAGFVDEFTGGTPQQNWTFASVPGGSSFTQSYSANNGGYLQLQSTSAVAAGGAAAAFGFVAQNFDAQGVIVRGTLNPNGAALVRDIGILANLNTSLLTGYGLTIDFVGGTLDMTIINAGGAATNLVTAFTIPNFSATNSYDVELQVAGGNVVGRLFDSSGGLIQTLEAASNAYTSGFAGVVASRDPGPDATLLGTFGRVSATAVPEPSAMGVLGLLAIAFTSVRRRFVA